MEPVLASITPVIDAWTARTGGAAVVSPAVVQELLFDIYDQVKGDRRESLVRSWLTLTIQRELFSATEVDELLRGLLDQVPEPTAAG